MTEDFFEKLKTPDYEFLENAGNLVDCLRCGEICRVADRSNRNARPFKRADGAGYCPNCAATEFLKTTFDIESILPEGTDYREALRAEHIQVCFAKLLKTGMSDLQEQEITWEKVIEHWDLPFSKKGKKKRTSKKIEIIEEDEIWDDIIE